MHEFTDPSLSEAFEALRKQALERLGYSGDALPESAEEPSAEQLYHMMLVLQQEKLHLAQSELKTLREGITQATAPTTDKFRHLFEYSGDALFLLLDNHFVDCNVAALTLVGATHKDQLLSRHAAELAPLYQPDGHYSREQSDEYYNLAVAQGQYRYEWAGQRCTGEEFWLEILLTSVEVNGQVHVQAVWRDITALKLAQQQHESERSQLRALGAAGVGTLIYTGANNMVLLDEWALAILDLPPGKQAISADEVRQRVHPEDIVAVEQALMWGAKTSEPLVVECRVVWTDGSVHHVRFRGEMEKDTRGRPVQLLGVLRNISGQYAAQQELSYKTLLLEQIMQHMPVILSRLTPEGLYLEMVGMGLRRLSLRDNELVGANLFEAFPNLTDPSRRPLGKESVSFVGSTDHEGERVYFHSFGFFNEQKQESIVFAIDVTESEQIKETLRLEKEFTKHLLNHSLDAFIALDLHLRVTAWNRTATLYTTLPEEQTLGQSFFDLLPHIDTPEMRHLLSRVCQGIATTQHNVPFKKRPGVYDVHYVPMRRSDDGEITGILIIIRDITERNRMLADAARLQRQQQQVVFQAIFTAQEAERKRMAEALHNGVGQLLYVTKLTLENQTHAGNPPDPAVLSVLNEAIKATRSVSHQLTPGILEDFGLQVALQELSKHIPPEKLRVHLHLTGLHELRPLLLDLAVYRIVQELLSNVIKHAQAREVHVQVEHDDDQIVLSVQDDGVGLPASSAPATMPGMGLASIRNRADLLGGRFALESRPGQGTVVRVALPINPEVSI
ncbi:PAS domain-containing sensor histidine kinase [Hymenobacter sp. HD11105]